MKSLANRIMTLTAASWLVVTLLIQSAILSGKVGAETLPENPQPIYRIVYAGCWSSADTNFPGPFPSIGLVFATNVASCFVSNSTDQVNWNCWTELSNVTAGQTNFVSYCCAPHGPSQIFFKVAFPQ